MIVIIDKPSGITSHDVINKLRQITGIQKIGHAGTLDPMATGVLVVGISKVSTKKLDQILKSEKEYKAKITLGAQSSTDDAEGKIEKIKDPTHLKLQDVEKIIPCYLGEIEQIPPIYSAIQVNGKRAYQYARNNQELTLQKRKIFIKNIQILSFHEQILTIIVTCGSGVYIKSIS